MKHPFAQLVCDGTLAKLESGDMLPRVGDFVKSAVNFRACGFVEGIKYMGHKNNRIAVFVVRLANRKTTSILQNDICFLAPFEADIEDDDEQEKQTPAL